MKDQYQKISQQIIVNYLVLFVSMLLGPISLFLLTRYLTVSEYGVYSLLAITVTILMILLDFGFPYFIITKLTGVDKKKKSVFFSSIFFFESLLGLFLFLIIILSPLQNFLIKFLKLDYYTLEFRISLLIIFFGLLIRILNSFLASEKKLEIQALNNFLQQGLWVLIFLVSLGFILKISLLHVMFFWLLGMFFTFISAIFFNRHIFSFTFSGSHLKKAMIFSFPLVLLNLGSWLIVSMGRYVLNYLSDLEQVAYYSFAFSLVSLISSLSTTISATLYPYFSEAWNKNKNPSLFFNVSIKYTLLLIIPSISILLVLHNQIILLIASEKYLSSAPIVLLLLLVPFFSAINAILIQNLLSNGENMFLAVLYISATLVNLLLAYFFGKLFGGLGVAFVTTLIYFIIFMVMLFVSLKYIKINFDYLKLFRIVLCSFFVLFFLFIVNPISLIPLIFYLILSICIYVLSLFLFGVFSDDELKLLKTYLRSLLFAKFIKRELK